MSSRARIDKFFLFAVVILTLAGFGIFLSASLGLLTQDGASFSSIVVKQTISLLIGTAAFYFFSKVKYTVFRKYALFILLGAIGINLILFIPAFSVNHGGASRWISVAGFNFQPSELLKIAFIIYLAAWFQFVKDKVKMMRFGIIPYIVLTLILSILLLSQSDTDTLVIIAGTGIVMMIIAGVPIRHIGLGAVLLGLIVVGVVTFRPYALERVKTFFNRGSDTNGSGYQINQSLIAIGSGGAFGRGFGQSVQKFGYLPQPTDDSIFAVAAEEFGFVGTTILIAMYLTFAAACFRIATKANDAFGGLVASGIAILVIVESFINMSAMLGLIPLSGVPLLFVSHGGTALIITLAAAGIVANISKHRR